MREDYQVGEVEKNVPIVRPITLGGCPPKYPWLSMDINESFRVRCPMAEHKRLWSTLTSSARNIERKHKPRKYLMRAVPGGIRIWRIA